MYDQIKKCIPKWARRKIRRYVDRHWGYSIHPEKTRVTELLFQLGKSEGIDERTVIPETSFFEGPGQIVIGTGNNIGENVVFRPMGGTIITGNECNIGNGTIIQGPGMVCLGNRVDIGSGCVLKAEPSKGSRPGGIYLMGDNLIGESSFIFDDVTMGRGAKVLPKSKVRDSVAAMAVSGEAPALETGKRGNNEWNYYEAERASAENTPEDIMMHVMRRGKLASRFLSAGWKVLDMGCGEGFLTADLAEKVNIIGCDYSSETIESARKRFPEIRFEICNITNIPFVDGSFDAVLMLDVAEHLVPAQFWMALSEVFRMLRWGGRLILATPLTGAGAKTDRYAHLYEYSPGEMYHLLSGIFPKVKYRDPHFGFFVAEK